MPGALAAAGGGGGTSLQDETTQTQQTTNTVTIGGGINSPFPSWPDPLRRGLTTESPLNIAAVGFALLTLLAVAFVVVRHKKG